MVFDGPAWDWRSFRFEAANGIDSDVDFNSIDYYESVAAFNAHGGLRGLRDTKTFYRLFMAPGHDGARLIGNPARPGDAMKKRGAGRRNRLPHMYRRRSSFFSG